MTMTETVEQSNTPEPAGENDWRLVGTVVGNAGTSEFTFILQQFQAKVGDIVALEMEIPGNDYTHQRRIYVWARIVSISRFNPFFPYEAAQELAGEGISLEDTILSGTRDQLEAKALILGTTEGDNLHSLFPLTYPVKPASQVWYPPADMVTDLLTGGRVDARNIAIGSLIARNDVDVTLSAPKLVSRHMAILAMTGGGKTVAARRMIRELIELGYPLLILDPHGDYIGLLNCVDSFRQVNPAADVRLFYPELMMQRDGEGIVETLISQMTNGLTEPQSTYLQAVFSRTGNAARDGESTLDYINRIRRDVNSDYEGNQAPNGLVGNWKGTVGAVRRALGIISGRLERMRDANHMMRSSPSLSRLPFEALPNPFGQPEQIIRPNQTSILYLGGYDHITQCSIASIVLDTLFDYRARLSGRIAPFMTVIEEAHTFIPSHREGTSDAVSLNVVRRIITEGRKFGTGLMLISQRPSRLDETIVSQCNSFLILRLVNPKDQNFVRAIMENLTEADAKLIPGFGPGQGIVSGQVVRFPLPVQVRMDEDLLSSEIGDENFFDQVASWQPDADAGRRTQMSELMEGAAANRQQRTGGNSSSPRRGSGRSRRS